jgi:hypothetical protein
MTTYALIDNTEVDPESPITTSLVTRLRDNFLAIAEGDSSAPSIARKAIDVGGSDIDGAYSDGAAPTNSGVYEYSSFNQTIARTFPIMSILRINGNFTLSHTLSVTRLTTVAHQRIAESLGALVGANAETSTPNSLNTAGAGSVGAGGTIAGDGADSAAASGTGWAIGSLSRWWALRRGLVGGLAGSSGTAPTAAGGCIIIIVNGNMVLTGGTIDASALDVITSGGGNPHAGGCGGGSVIVICNGTVTDGTFKAYGGDGVKTGATSAGGGGGGYVGIIAKAYAGTQTIDVTCGGGNSGDGTVGAAVNGFSEKLTLTKPQIDGIIFR